MVDHPGISKLAKPFYPSLLWKVETDEKVLFLTFDDGPTPEVTSKALSILSDYNAKATFFCIGKNVKEHPEIYQEILRQGHQVGNHTQAHDKGWVTNDFSYYRSVLECSQSIASNLFRPPYGRIKRSQIFGLRSKYQIVMWDVLSLDYSKDVNGDECAQNVIRYSDTGSIVVFHDSRKAAQNMLHALPLVLEHFSKLGYQFNSLPSPSFPLRK